MKSKIAILQVLFSIISLFSLSGCWELMEADGVGGLADVRVLSDDAVVLDEGGLKINGEGRLIATNQVSLNQLLGEIELRRMPGQNNPELFIKGKPTAFAEVLTNENKVRILEYNREFAVSNSIYSVEGETVYVRAKAEITSNNIVGKVYKGNLVVTLSEESGWYQVKVVQNTKITYGWIEAKYLAPLVLATSSGYDCSKERSGNYTFVNQTNFRCAITLYPASMPSEWIGNPGLQNSGEAALAPHQAKTLFNLKSDNYQYRITFKVPTNYGFTYSYENGQIQVETCQTQVLNIK
jgi:hypothetical protein